MHAACNNILFHRHLVSERVPSSGIKVNVMDSEELTEFVDGVIESHGADASSPLIPILQEIQDKYGYLPMDSLRRVSERTGYSPSHVYGVATFYHQFRLRPEGKHVIMICRGTACHVSGTTKLYDMLLDELGLTPPEDTTPDGLFTVQQVRCIGACSLAPVVKVDDQVYGKLTAEKLKGILEEVREAER